MALHDVAAQRVAGADRALEVDLVPRRELAEAGARLGLAEDVRREARTAALRDRQAHTVDGDRLALLKRPRPRLVRLDFEDQPRAARDALHGSDFLHYSREHRLASEYCVQDYIVAEA